MLKKISKPTMRTIRIPGRNLHPGNLPSAFLTPSPTFSPQGQPEMVILKPEVAVPGRQIVKTEGLKPDLLERIRSLEDTITELKNRNEFLEEEKRDLQEDVNYYIRKFGPRRRRCTQKRRNIEIKVEQKDERDDHDNGEVEKSEIKGTEGSSLKKRRIHPPESTLEYSYTLDYNFQKSERPSSPNPHSIPIQFGQN